MISNNIRLDHRIIFSIVEKGAKILDLGCGEGDLLHLLTHEKQIIAQGIEKDDSAIQECVKKGLSVFHDDIESGLREYPDMTFDYVILNQSMEEIKNVDSLIHEALRIGNKIIISFPNFAYYKSRLMLFLKGRAPVTKSLPYSWFDTPNVRFLSITDFREFCIDKKIGVIKSFFLGENRVVRFFPNLLALNAIFVLGKGEAHK
jgi:methionine biosynthesis protein MetW